MKPLQWINPSTWREENGKLIITAPANTDYFRNPGQRAQEGITPESYANAPFGYNEVTGDFVLRAKVSHDFKDVYDACVLMIMQDEQVWAKACFELTDFGTHAVVSVVTNQLSDDANGCNIEGNSVWLQACRVGDAFAFHYSLDGKTFYMMRYFTIPVGKTVKVGLLAQAPQGKGGERVFEHVTLEQRTVGNIRVGA